MQRKQKTLLTGSIALGLAFLLSTAVTQPAGAEHGSAALTAEVAGDRGGGTAHLNDRVWETCIPRQCSQTVHTFSSLRECEYFRSTRNDPSKWIACREKR